MYVCMYACMLTNIKCGLSCVLQILKACKVGLLAGYIITNQGSAYVRCIMDFPVCIRDVVAVASCDLLLAIGVSCDHTSSFCVSIYYGRNLPACMYVCVTVSCYHTYDMEMWLTTVYGTLVGYLYVATAHNNIVGVSRPGGP
jgi:hypothetical protein